MLRYFFKTFLHDRLLHAATMSGVIVATMMLVGALLVGHSMRESLKRLTLDRLGRINSALQGDHFFSETLLPDAVPVIQLKTAARIANPGQGDTFTQTGGVRLFGVDDAFEPMWEAPVFSVSPSQWKPGEAVVNRSLAEQLQITQPGAAVVLFFAKPMSIAAESVLGHKTDTLLRLHVTIREIIPDEQAGAFALTPNQRNRTNIYVPLVWLQEKLDLSQKVNLLLSKTSLDRGNLKKRATPVDLGLVFRRNEQKTLHIQSEKMLFSDSQAKAIETVLRRHLDRPVIPSLLSLAVSLRFGEHETPYSTILGIDLPGRSQRLNDDEIILNRWTADDLQAAIGDQVELTFFDPVSLHGETETRTVALRVADIIDMTGLASDPEIVPELHGLTDSTTIGQWEPPFPFEMQKIRKKDELYWEQYRAVPKAFVSLETGRRLGAGRFGNTTSLSIVGVDPMRQQELEAALVAELDQAMFGLLTLPVREQGLKASSGTTPFAILFLAFSFFIIASALMLLAMLFQLSMEVRSKRLGILLTLGFTPRQLSGQLLVEGMLLSLCGGLIGVLLGILYAGIMVHGLNTWWIGSISTPFLRLSIGAIPLVSGFCIGTLVSFVVIAVPARRLVRKTPLELIRSQEQFVPPGQRKRRGIFPIGCLVLLMLGFIPVSAGLPYIDWPIFFFVSAVILLIAFLRYADAKLAAGYTTVTTTLWSLALSNASRARRRSLLTIALLATSTFMIFSTGAFRLKPAAPTSEIFSGTGGFSLVFETDSPIFHDLNTESGRYELGFHVDDEKFLNDVEARFVPIRVRDGDQAGCLNLYRPETPRILGVPDSMTGFTWTERLLPKHDLWNRLDEPVVSDQEDIRSVPMILENNTAIYSLRLYGGVGDVLEINDDQDQPIRLRTAALLSNTIFQEDLLISESNLTELFPEVSGYRSFLVSVSPRLADNRDTLRQLEQTLYRTLGDFGLVTERTESKLARYFAVQNTYLSTFQALGTFGLLLGTAGLAIVQIRNILVRRRELALLSVIGFSRRRILMLLFGESFSLFVIGLLIGFVTAMFAVVPQLTTRTVSFPIVEIGLVFLFGTLSILSSAIQVFRLPVADLLRQDH